nr:ROK family transcriptional regulator [uncultured Gellertiella sp.]
MLAKSSTEIVRQQNSGLVLAALRRHGPLAHTELSDRTHLSSATVSAITAELERQQVIERQEQASPAGRGRPRVSFVQRRGCGYMVALRISSDMLQYSLVDYGGTLIDRIEENRQGDAGQALLFTGIVRAAIERLAARSGLGLERILVVSISSKGLVDPVVPVLLWSPVFGADSIDFDRIRGGDLQPDVILSNETRLVAAALARIVENQGGDEGPDPPRALCALSLGHGIGLGIARREASGEYQVSAPDFGHMLHVANGGLCRCGSVGCIEATAGFYGILRIAFDVPADTIPARFIPLIEMEKLAANARRGDRKAQLAFRQAGIALGQGLGRMQSLNEKMPVYITGPGVRFYDLMEKGLTDGLSQSRTIRREGQPDLHVILDETALVFAGHMDLALSHMDRNAVGSGLAG